MDVKVSDISAEYGFEPIEMQPVDLKLSRYDQQLASMLSRLRTHGLQFLVTKKAAYVICPISDRKGEIIKREIVY